MRTITHILTTILIIIIMCGCNKSRRYDSATLHVNVDDETPLADFFDSYRYVMLETNDSCLIHESAIFKTNESNIVSYSEYNGFMIFDAQGKHMTSFNHKGEGPGEYLYVSDFYITPTSIFLLDVYINRLLEYSISDGAFIREIKLADHFQHCAPLDNHNVALCAVYGSLSKYNFAILNLQTGEINKQFAPYEQIHSYLFDGYTAFVGKGKTGVYAALPFSHNLYYVTADSCNVVESYYFNTAKQFPDIKDSDIDIANMYDEYRYENVVMWLRCYTKQSSGVCYQAFRAMGEYGITAYICKYDISGDNCKSTAIGTKRSKDFPYLTVGPSEFNNNEYVCVMSAERLLRAEKLIEDNTFTQSGLTEDSNPVIFFYHFKE